MQPTKKELRELLLDAIEQVKDGTLEPDKAAAVADLSQAVINADRFQLEALAFVAEHGGRPSFIDGSVQLAIEHQAEPDGETDDEEEPDDEPEPEKPKPKPPAKPKSRKPPSVTDLRTGAVAQALKREQPVDLEELAGITKIPQADLFEILKGEQFERDTDGFYWMAK